MKTTTHILVLFIICLGLTSGFAEPTQAASPCIWTGAANRDWMNLGNWTCGMVPDSTHDVTIANLANYPIIIANNEVQVNSLLIEAGGALEVTNGGRFSLISQSMTAGIINYGTIKTTGTLENTAITFFTGRTFDNYGTIDIGVGVFNVTAYKGGTQNGMLSGSLGTINLHGESGTFSFGSSSSITVKNIFFDHIPTVNIWGKFNQPWPSGSIRVSGSYVKYYFSLPHSLGVITITPPGSFIMTSSGSHIGSIRVLLMSILNGTGSISENLENYGTVSPGESAGVLSVGGNYTQFVTDEPGVLEIELGGLDAGTTYDQLLVTGLATLDGTLKVNFIESFIPSEGDTFTIMTYGSRLGEFDVTEFPTLPAGLSFEVNYGEESLILTVVSEMEVPLFIYLPVVIR